MQCRENNVELEKKIATIFKIYEGADLENVQQHFFKKISNLLFEL